MAGPNLPEVPVPLKNINPYLKIANDHDQRDLVVSYWCRLYALQTGLKLSTKTTEETNFLLKLMDWLETTKKANSDNDAITNDVAAQAHLENWALKLFLYADKNDRASNFSKSTIQSFYTAGLLYDVLTTFGELSEEAGQNKKYAKWKAAYIHNCLKNGETPIPGPLPDENDDDDMSNEKNGSDRDGNEDNEDNENDEDFASNQQPTQPGQPTMPFHPTMPMQPLIPTLPSQPPSSMGPFDFPSVPDPHSYNPASTPTNPGISSSTSLIEPLSLSSGGVALTVEQTGKAQKYIKWAGSALNYDDVPTAVANLQKALHLLTTGEDSI